MMPEDTPLYMKPSPHTMARDDDDIDALVTFVMALRGKGGWRGSEALLRKTITTLLGRTDDLSGKYDQNSPAMDAALRRRVAQGVIVGESRTSETRAAFDRAHGLGKPARILS